MNLVPNPLSIAITSALFTFSAQSFSEESTQVNKELVSDLEIITVTGDFRQNNLQKIPSSLSVLNADDIKTRNAQNLEEIIAATPNVNFASGSQRARYYQIRGIGERSQFQEPINPSVGLIIDDIDFTGIGSIASMFDVAQTEIYRGPQGTRFGANAMAGLINITTNAPTDEFESSMRLTAGNYGSLGGGIVLSGPANDAINYRVAIEQYQSDGFIENSYLGIDDTNNRDELTMRGKLAIQASDDLTIDIALTHFNFDNGYDAFSLDNTRETFSDEPGFDRQETTAFSSKFSYSAFKAFELIGIVSYADSDLSYGYDEDWSNETLCQLNECPYGDYSSTDHYFRARETLTGEIRLVSDSGHKIFNDSTEWIVGFYLKKDDETLLRQYTYLESDYSSDFNTNTLAIYAQFNSQLSDKLSLISGIRVEQRSADYINSDLLSFEPIDTMVGGKLVLSYQHNDNNLFYGSINRGYKAGGVNTDGSLPDALREFEPEFVVNYELGYKVSLLNNLAYLRAAVFYMNREDVQVKTSLQELRDDGSVEFIPYLGNAAKGVNKGIEIDGAWQVIDNVELYGSLGLLDTQFNDFINDDGVSLSGREQAHAPNFQFNLGI
ncbi:MAG: TonB-dependent receptor, partial [Colwellia sp.]|nr:TonB-dependent receptor [Colwellia sp.]